MKKLMLAAALLALAGCGKSGGKAPTTDKTVAGDKFTYRVGSPRDSVRSFLDAMRYKDETACRKILTDKAWASAASGGFESMRQQLAALSNKMQTDDIWLLSVSRDSATVKSRGYAVTVVFDFDRWRVDSAAYNKSPLFPK